MTAGTQTYWKMVKSGSSYLSQSELPLSFGLGQRTAVDKVEIEWPSGAKTSLGQLTAGQAYEVVEGKGIARSWALRK